MSLQAMHNAGTDLALEIGFGEPIDLCGRQRSAISVTGNPNSHIGSNWKISSNFWQY